VTTGGNAADAPMFSREELLGGLPARRASTVLFAIEAHTARLMASSRVQRASYVGRRGAVEREQAFLEALAAGRDLPLTPTIQDLERHAPQWSHLVPEGAEARAALAVLFGAKYRFTADRVPRLRTALGLDTPQVAAALARQAPDRAVYVPSLTLRERIAWRRAALAQRIERLPPFWIAYFLALTETVTEGILILPVAVAGIGPVGGVVVLVVLGAINLVTIGSQAEAIARNGSMRYGAAYFGRLVSDLLGRAGSVSLSVALAVFNAVVLLAYLLGFASVLTGATGITEEAWVLLLFAINAWVLRRGTLDETVATAVILGTINIALIVAITALAFANLDPANLGAWELPFVGGLGLDPTILQLVFGVIIVSYFGHTSAANASKLILGQDPSGRALIWGNLAALATVIGLYSVIVVAFLGALGPDPLVDTRGTAITPLAEVVGPIVDVLGSIYVVLAVGLGSLYCSLGLYNQVVELLPVPARRGAGTTAQPFLASRAGRYLAGISPSLLTTAVLLFLLVTDQDWFARPVAVVGVLTIPLLGGVVPMLLLLAARRRGEYVPAGAVGFFGHPITVGAISAVFLAAIALHAFVIWEDPIERAAALLMTVFSAGLVLWILRGPAFRRSVAIEIRDAQRGTPTEPAFNVVVAGRARSADVRLERTDGTTEVHAATGPLRLAGLTRATFSLADHAARELKVWVHRVTPDGESVGLPASIEVVNGTDEAPMQAMRGSGMVATEIGLEPIRVAVTLERAD
jgi:hypothetical protein